MNGFEAFPRLLEEETFRGAERERAGLDIEPRPSVTSLPVSTGFILRPTGGGSTNTGTAPPNPPDDMTFTIPNAPPPITTTFGPSQPFNPLTQDPFGGGLPTAGTNGGGGAPDWMCRLAGISAPCSYVDLVLAGAGHLFGGGGTGSEAPGGTVVPGLGTPGIAAPSQPSGFGDCPGALSVRNPITGQCVDLTALPPGGDPAFTPSGGSAVLGRFGAGVRPMQRSVSRLKCPRGMVLGKDNVCYDRLARSHRKWDPGMKPLLTGGDRAAIRKAAAAGRKLARSKKMIRKASRALDKVC